VREGSGGWRDRRSRVRVECSTPSRHRHERSLLVRRRCALMPSICGVELSSATSTEADDRRRLGRGRGCSCSLCSWQQRRMSVCGLHTGVEVTTQRSTLSHSSSAAHNHTGQLWCGDGIRSLTARQRNNLWLALLLLRSSRASLRPSLSLPSLLHAWIHITFTSTRMRRLWLSLSF
jgi:hypothetical protein